jgi:leader peptidase (prepilin peptidase)/N-methyltransferase
VVSASLEILFGPPLGYVFAAVWGALWGSFYNVVIVYGLGRRQSLITPASHCLACHTPIKFYDNVPLLSYLVLRGRCRACGARFSSRYFVVEALAAGLTTLLYWRFVAASPHGGDLVLRLGHFLIYEKFAGLLLVLSAIDLELLIIPDRLTYPSIPAAMAVSLLLPLPSWWDGLVGAVAGYLVIWLIAEIYYLVRRREGMGLGDAKLLAIIGAILGWRALPYVIFLASLQGSLVGLVGLLVGARFATYPDGAGTDEAATAAGAEPAPAGAAGGSEPADDDTTASPGPATPFRFAAIPFGPFLAVAALEVLFLSRILQRYVGFFGL